jgi:hypothetical protein
MIARQNAVDHKWQNLDACVEEKVDRHTVQYDKFMAREATAGRKRVCWNSWIAPHNFEGFFLNMGDMLVKAGRPRDCPPRICQPQAVEDP